MYEQLAPFKWLAGAKLPELPVLTELGLEVWWGAQGHLGLRNPAEIAFRIATHTIAETSESRS